MTNFDFLNTDKQFSSFADVAIAAERLLPIDVDSCVSNCRRAMERAASDMSTAVTAEPGASSASVQAMQPEPVQRSSARPPPCRSHPEATAASSSVSGLGISTAGLTLNRRPQNS